MGQNADIEQHMDLFDGMLSNLKESASQGMELPLDELVAMLMPDDGECHCGWLAPALGIAIQRLVLTASDSVH